MPGSNVPQRSHPPNHFLKYLYIYILYDHGPWKSQQYVCKYDIYLYLYIYISYHICFFLVDSTHVFFPLPRFFRWNLLPTFVIRITPRCPLTPFAVLKLIQGLGEKKTWSKAWALKVFPFTTCILFFFTLQNWGGKLVDNFHGFGT